MERKMNDSKLRYIVSALLLCVATLGADVSGAQESARKRPSIVFMLVDNMGYGDLGSYGGGVVRGAPTPRLDALAEQGLRLTNFNVEAECTPSRSSLMTGRLPVRSGTSSVHLLGGVEGLTPWEYTLAELLSDAGYSTAMYGKWHLGNVDGRFPNDQGFDEWYGIARSTDPALWNIQSGFDPARMSLELIYAGEHNKSSRRVKDYTYEARRTIDREVTDRAVAYIQRQAQESKPFFLYVPFTLPHAPAIPHPDFEDPGKSDYQNVLSEIDHNAGRVIDAVDEAGIGDNTIIVFASDNGPQTMVGTGIEYGAHSDTGPFRAEFASAWEGAIRTPAVIRWNGKVKAGRESNEIISILDFYRTFATVAEAAERVPEDRPIDSIDQHAFFFEDKEKSNREHVLFFHSGELLAVKWNAYKTHFVIRTSGAGQVQSAGQGMFTSVQQTVGYPLVFDVENDPKELFNINGPNGWLTQVISPYLGKYYNSLREFPNILPGTDKQ